MDKNKSVEEIKQLVEKKQYSRALERLERMDMQTELTEGDLAVFAEVYICNKQFAKAKALLEVMFNNNASKKVISQLIFVSMIMNELNDAEKYYNEYKKIAPKDKNTYVFRYRLDKAQKKDMYTLIESLEKIEENEFVEEFAYDLAKLYFDAGYEDKCIKKCNEIMVLSNNKDSVDRATKLKEKCLLELDDNKELGISKTSNSGSDIWKQFQKSSASSGFVSNSNSIDKMNTYKSSFEKKTNSIKKDNSLENIEAKARLSIELNARKALEEKFKELEDKKREAEDKLKKEVIIRKKYEAKLSKSETINQNLESKIARDLDEKRNLLSELDKANSEKSELAGKLNVAVNEKEALERRFQELNENFKLQSNKLLKQISNSKELENELLVNKDKVEELNHRIQVAENTKNQLLDQLDTKNKIIDDLENEVRENEDKIVDLNGEVEKINEEIRELTEKSNEQIREITEKSNEQVRNLTEKSNEEIRELKEKSSEQIRNLTERLESEVTNVKVRDERINSLSNEKNELLDQNRKIDQHRRVLQNDLKDCIYNRKILENKVNQSIEHKKYLEARLAKLEDERNELDNKAREQQSQAIVLEDTIRQNEERIKEMERQKVREINDLLAKNASEKKLFVERANADKQALIDKFTAEKNELEHKLNSTSRELQDRINEFATNKKIFEERMSKSVANNKLLDQNLKSKIDIINSLDARIKAVMNEKKILTEQKKQLEDKLVNQINNNKHLDEIIRKHINGKRFLEEQLSKGQEHINMLKEKNNQGAEIIKRLEEKLKNEISKSNQIEQKLKDSQMKCDMLDKELKQRERIMREARDKEINLIEESGEALLGLTGSLDISSALDANIDSFTSSMTQIDTEEGLELDNKKDEFDSIYDSLSSSISEFLDEDKPDVLTNESTNSSLSDQVNVSLDTQVNVPIGNSMNNPIGNVNIDKGFKDIEIPLPNLEPIGIPEPKATNIGIPEPKMSNMGMPDIKMPEIKMPEIKMPESQMPETKATSEIGSFFESPEVPEYKKAYEDNQSVVSKLFGASDPSNSRGEYNFVPNNDEKQKYYQEVMQSQLLGNYNANYQSSPGQYTKESLSGEIFSYYFSSPFIMDQIQRAIFNFRNDRMNNNFVITGPQCYNKNELSKMIAKQLYEKGAIATNKIARISGDAFNKVDLDSKAPKLIDGCIIIQNAETVTNVAFNKLIRLISNYQDRIIVILETDANDNQLFTNSPNAKAYFGSIIKLPAYSIQFLMDYSKTYLVDNNMGISEEAENTLAGVYNNKLRNNIRFALIDVADYLNTAIEAAARRKKGKGKHPTDIIIRQDININW